VAGEVLEHRVAEAAPAPRIAHEHALQLAERGKELDAAAGRRLSLGARHEEMHAFANELLHAVAVPALFGVERVQYRFKVFDQGNCVGGVGALARDLDRHRATLP
jgi:hypothetical protein